MATGAEVVTVEVVDPLEVEGTPAASYDPADMLTAVSESLAPGDLQTNWMLSPFVGPAELEEKDNDDSWLWGIFVSFVSSPVEQAFQAQMTRVRVGSWSVFLSCAALVATYVGVGGLWGNAHSVFFDNSSSHGGHNARGMLIIGLVCFFLLVFICANMQTLSECHHGVQWGSELCFTFFSIQHMFISYTYFNQPEGPPNMNQLSRTVGIAILMPFCMACLASSRPLVFFSWIGCCVVVVQSPWSGYANNFWMIAGSSVAGAMTYFSMLKDRDAFVKYVELTIFKRMEMSGLQQRVELTVAQAKYEQEKATAKALEQQKAYQKIVAATAHDLRTASSAMLSGCRVLNAYHAASLKRDPGLAEHRKKEVDVVESMSAMAKVINIFLEGMTLSARLLDGMSVPIMMQKVDLKEIVEESIACSKLACSGTGRVEHVVVVDPALGHIYTDLNCISRNLMNLVSNASRYTVEGSIQVNVLLDRQGVYIEISVRDTGTGVPNEMKQCIFEPFISMDDSTGLGLFVVRMQSEALGGSCGVRDNPVGRGAEFWFRVPYITTKEDAAQHLGSNHRIQPELIDSGVSNEGINVFGVVGDQIQISSGGTNDDDRGGGGNGRHVPSQSILLIDDNWSLLEVHAAELINAGYSVTKAHGATQGLEFLKLKIYSLVLIDIKMPTLSGDELVAAFRHWESYKRPHARQVFYALSAYTNQDVQDRCRVVGMKGVIAKPLRPEVITGLRQAQGTQVTQAD